METLDLVGILLDYYKRELVQFSSHRALARELSQYYQCSEAEALRAIAHAILELESDCPLCGRENTHCECSIDEVEQGERGVK